MADRDDPAGFDMKYGTDLDRGGRSCSGAELVEDGILHRLMADTLPCIGAPGGFVAFGVNVKRWIGEVTTQSRADAKGPELVMVIARDSRVDAGSIDVQITVEPDGAEYDLTIAIDCRTTTGIAISMVVGVSGLTVERLAQQGTA